VRATPISPEHAAELVSELTNSLQSAVQLSCRLESGLRQMARDAGELLAAIDRFSTALQQFRHEADKGGAQ
jgi:pyruvate/oxaloacetate carboxyltransferase